MSIEPTVFIVDDDPAVRDSLQRLVESVNLHAQVFAEAQSFLDQYQRAQPGCLLLDIHMRGFDGLELQEHLRRAGITLPVIVVSAHGDVEKVVRAMKAGAVHFIKKPYKAKVLLAHVHDALELDARVRQAAAQQAAAMQRLQALTPREREVVDLLVTGMPSKLVALQLGLSRKTVDVHRSHIMMKLGVDSTIELARLVQTSRTEPSATTSPPPSTGPARPPA